MLKSENLLKLAAYLEKLPDDYEAFEMRTFFRKEGDYAMEVKYARENGGVDKCGAVACAVGHGPSAGFLVPEHMIANNAVVNWSRYVDEFFIDGYCNRGPVGVEERNAFEWMFSGGWSYIDNTPAGAAKRIRWLVAGNEIPDIDSYGYYDPAPEHVDLYQDA